MNVLNILGAGGHGKVCADIWYAKHISFALDIRIFFITISRVLMKEGISSENSSTMEKFMGKK